MSVFISYSSADDDYARRLYKAFQLNHISAWFAPKDISGGQNFAEEIGAELTRHKSTDEFERIMEDSDHLTSSSTDVFLLLLSEHSMRSMWVKKELMMAIREKIPVLVVQVDHAVLTKEFDYLLQEMYALSDFLIMVFVMVSEAVT